MIQLSVNLLLWTSVAILAVPVVTFLTECLIASFGKVSRTRDPAPVPVGGSRTRRADCVVMIPAHDEEKMLPETLHALRGELGPGDRVVVVADNCSDQTAEVAVNIGFDVLVRNQPERRGKGYATQHGLEALRGDPPEVVVFLDADCQFGSGSLEVLVNKAVETDSAVQSRYLMIGSSEQPAATVISEFAVLVKNWVRPRALSRCSIGVPLTGSGMAFPWTLAESLRLASGNLVEDMDLSCELTCRNRGAVFCEDAIVTAPLPVCKEAAMEQRKRWEQGHLRTIRCQVIPMVLASLRHRSLGILGSAIDLCVPPLTLLMVLIGAVWMVSVATFPYDIRPFVATSVMVAAIALAIFTVAFRFSGDRQLWSAFAMAPAYAIKKIPIYFRFLLRQGRSEWIRTAR